MRIEHIALYVNDLESARRFFVKYFGATSNDGYHNPQTDFRSYFLSFDNGARLEIMNKPNMSCAVIEGEEVRAKIRLRIMIAVVRCCSKVLHKKPSSALQVIYIQCDMFNSHGCLQKSIVA